MARLPKVKLSAIPVFPSNVSGGLGVDVTKANGAYSLALDVSTFHISGVATVDAPSTYAVSWGGVTSDNPAGTFSLVPYSQIQTVLGTVTTGIWNATPIAANFGGTGQTAYAIGDLLYANTASTLAKLSDIATGNALISGGVGVAPSYGKIGISTHVSGLGTGIATALGINVGTAGAPVVSGGALGTPSSGIATNLTGTAAGLTAGNVTTNANLTGDVTSVGNATTLTNAPVIAKVLTGFTSGAGTVSATDSILSAFQKINGNVAGKQATLTAGQLPGTATNDNASAGNIGEYVQSVVLSGSPVALTSGTQTNVTSISLTAGDWDVDGVVYHLPAATTSYTRYIGSLSTTSATLDVNPGKFADFSQAAFVSGGNTFNDVIPPYRFSLSGTTTVFLVALGFFTVSTAGAYGIIRARRVR